MSQDSIEIRGKATGSDFPECSAELPFTQICETDTLILNGLGQTLHHLRGIEVRVAVKGFKKLCSPAGKKLFVRAIKIIRLAFGGAPPYRMCSREYRIPFCFFINLGCTDRPADKVVILVEDTEIDFGGTNRLIVSSLLFAWPILRLGCEEDDNSFRCDIQIKKGKPPCRPPASPYPEKPAFHRGLPPSGRTKTVLGT
jgi:hypothetical protein